MGWYVVSSAASVPRIGLGPRSSSIRRTTLSIAILGDKNAVSGWLYNSVRLVFEIFEKHAFGSMISSEIPGFTSK